MESYPALGQVRDGLVLRHALAGIVGIHRRAGLQRARRRQGRGMRQGLVAGRIGLGLNRAECCARKGGRHNRTGRHFHKPHDRPPMFRSNNRDQ